MNKNSLQMKNATVAMLLVCPLLFTIVGLVATMRSDQQTPPPKSHDQPPIIRLSESDGFTFESGKAELNEAFKTMLNTIAPEIVRLSKEHDCDVVEIIGHTDGQRVSGTQSNIDDSLMVGVHRNREDLLRPGSNADLGLMRAWAIANFLRRHPGMSALKFYAYSAGQALRPDGSYSIVGDNSDQPSARRIEIRLRRSAPIAPR